MKGKIIIILTVILLVAFIVLNQNTYAGGLSMKNLKFEKNNIPQDSNGLIFHGELLGSNR